MTVNLLPIPESVPFFFLRRLVLLACSIAVGIRSVAWESRQSATPSSDNELRGRELAPREGPPKCRLQVPHCGANGLVQKRA